MLTLLKSSRELHDAFSSAVILKIFIFCLFFELLAAFGCPSQASDSNTSSGQGKSVYISNRTDGRAGRGTASDPFNGSTEARFDALMRWIGANTVIHILAGTYSTWGCYDSLGKSGFMVKPGWKVYGAGKGATILKLTGFPTSAITENPTHFYSNGAICDGFEVHDITLDCNAGALLGGGMLNTRAVSGVIVNGSNTIVDNVEVINSYGYRRGNVYGNEGFSIAMGGRSDRHATNVRISNCYTHSYHNLGGVNYSNGPGLANCDAGGVIENCVDDGGNHGFGGGGNREIVFKGNMTTSHTETGFYLDTGGDIGLEILSNTFAAARFPIQFNTASNCSAVVVEGNTLICANTAYSPAAIYMTGSGSINGFSCLNNTYTGNANFLSAQGGATYTNFTVTGNTCIGNGALLSNIALQLSPTNRVGANTLHATK